MKIDLDREELDALITALDAANLYYEEHNPPDKTSVRVRREILTRELTELFY